MKLDGVQHWMIEFDPDVDLAFLDTFCVPLDANDCSTYTRALLKSVSFIGSFAAARQQCEPHLMRIRWVTPDFDIYIMSDQMVGHENENSFVQRNGLWGLDRVRASERSSQGQGVTICIFDTEVRVTHQDFTGRGIPTLDITSGSPVECNGATSCAGDRQGHGTHCAGTAACQDYGVAPAATVRSVKVLADQRSGSWSWSYGGLDWVA